MTLSARSTTYDAVECQVCVGLALNIHCVNGHNRDTDERVCK